MEVEGALAHDAERRAQSRDVPLDGPDIGLDVSPLVIGREFSVGPLSFGIVHQILEGFAEVAYDSLSGRLAVPKVVLRETIVLLEDAWPGSVDWLDSAVSADLDSFSHATKR